MKAYMSLPSGTYNLIFTKDELQNLVNSKHIFYNVGHTPCKTGRVVWNADQRDFETLEQKDCYNDLRFNFDEPVADISAGDYPVQFLTISVED